jgi:hypothetical protein
MYTLKALVYYISRGNEETRKLYINIIRESEFETGIYGRRITIGSRYSVIYEQSH